MSPANAPPSLAQPAERRRTVARWVSIIAHPFISAIVLAAAVELERGATEAAHTAAVVGLLFVAPLLLLTALQVRRGAWGTVDASDPRERPVLFATGAAALIAVLAYLARTQPRSPLVTGAAGVLAMLALCAAITRWIKVSLHMAAAALAAAVLLGRGQPIGWVFAAVLPPLAWSRLALGRHRPREVALGLVVGAVTGILIVRFTAS